MISATVKVVFQPVTPLMSFFYANVNELTIRSLANASGYGDVSLPDVLLDSGFPDGVEIAYAGSGATLPDNRKIEKGFFFIGTLKIFDMKFYCEVKVEVTKILINVKVPPIKIADGLIALRGSKGDLGECLQIYALISQNEVHVKIKSYAKFLLLDTEVNIDVSNSGIEFYAYGSLLNLLKANFTVSAPHWNILGPGFKVATCLSTESGDVKSASESEIEEAAHFAHDAVEDASKDVNKTNSFLQIAKDKLKETLDHMASFNEQIKNRADRLQKKEEELKSDCVCGKVWIGGPGWDKKCGWFGCPIWIEKKWLVADARCYVDCKVEKIVTKVKGMAEQALLKLASAAIEVEQKVVELAAVFVQKAGQYFDKLSDAFAKLKKSVEVGLMAFEKLNIRDQFAIDSVCLEADLRDAHVACFRFEAKVTYFGMKSHLNKRICLRNRLSELGQAIANISLPGILGQKDSVKAYKDSLNNEQEQELTQKKLEIDEKEKEFKNCEKEYEIKKLDIKEDEGDQVAVQREPKSDGLHMINSSYYQRLMYTPLPSYTIRDDVTLEQFNKYSAWALCEQDDPLSDIHFANVSGEDIRGAAHDKSNQYGNLDLNTKGCYQSRALINNYQMLADSARLMLQASSKVNAAYLSEVEKMKRNLDETTESVNRLSKNIKDDEARMEDSRFYLIKMEKGTRRWIDVMARHVQKLDEKSLVQLRLSMGKVMAKKYGLRLKDYIKKLKSSAKAASKRSFQDGSNSSNFPSVLSASKAAEWLLSGEDAGITSYENVIRQLEDETMNLKASITADC